MGHSTAVAVKVTSNEVRKNSVRVPYLRVLDAAVTQGKIVRRRKDKWWYLDNADGDY